MILVPAGMPTAFKRAVAVSVLAHIILLVLVVAAPDLPLSPKKRNVTYVNFLGFGGGGNGGGTGGGGSGKGATAAVVATPAPPPAKKEMLRDLTVASKVKPEPPATSLTHPVDKPKTGRPAPEKKATISRPEPNALSNAPEAAPESGAGTSGGASGVRIGVGGPPGGGGAGGGGFGGAGGGFGAGNFPYTYYIQGIMDRVSASWFTSLVDPGVSGSFQTTVLFKILRNGQIADLKVEQPSGISSLDLSALRAVQTAAPFPPLPGEYEDQFLLIHLIFEHAK